MSEPIIAIAPKNHYPKGLPPGAQTTPDESLKEVYDRYFRVVAAESYNLREKSFRLRYQVYCIENAYEPAADHPDGMETDAWDTQALHSLLVHGDGAVVGTVRLILPPRGRHGMALPIRGVCSAETLAAFDHRIPLDHAAEISRFAVTRQFRRRAGEVNTLAGVVAQIVPENPARLIPHISLGLMHAVLAMAIDGRVTHLVAAMEPTLLRMLQRLGIRFETMGPPVEYHGLRQPCFCDIAELCESIRSARPDVWSVLTDDGRLRLPDEDALEAVAAAGDALRL